MQTPSKKLIVHLLLGAVLQLAAFLAKDTAWLGWIPAPLQPVAVVFAQALAAVAAYYVAETNPPASALAAAFRRQPPPGA